MKFAFFFLVIGTLLSCVQKRDANEQVVFDRIEYIFHLKRLSNDSIWQGFTENEYTVPLVYYTTSNCYIANPTSEFLQNHNHQLVYSTKELTIYKTPLLDSIPFHMETSMVFDSKTTTDQHPIMRCSSFEITNTVIPDVNSTEMWATMVLHEYFHGFQFNHSSFNKYVKAENLYLPQDSINQLYFEFSWFKESIDKENLFLLSAIHTSDKADEQKHISEFFECRKARRLRTKNELGIDIQRIEELYETMEGTSRYIEYRLYKLFSTKNPHIGLAKSDSSYHSYLYFNNYKLEQDEWMYLTDKSTYFYATGFNIVRLLDKLNVDYQSQLFKKGELSLEKLIDEKNLK